MNYKNILIVDDAENNLTLLNDLLCEQNYNISLAHNAQEALKSIDKQVPDLILLDIMMPGIDGFEFFEIIKKDNPNIKVVFITARSNSTDQQKAIKMGAFDFITKPVNILHILKTVDKALN